MRLRNLPDSGERTGFETGAQRDAARGKGVPSMIPPEALMRIALRFEEGAEKYGPDNWRKGIPLSRYYDAMFRHLLRWGQGHTDEDHLGAVGWNYCAAIWTESEIKAGRLPAELDDRRYLTPETNQHAVPTSSKDAHPVVRWLSVGRSVLAGFRSAFQRGNPQV